MVRLFRDSNFKITGTFNVNDDHPLLERQQIYDDNGNFILPIDIKDSLDSYYKAIDRNLKHALYERRQKEISIVL